MVWSLWLTAKEMLNEPAQAPGTTLRIRIDTEKISIPNELFSTHIIRNGVLFDIESAKRLCDQRGLSFAQISDNNTVFENKIQVLH